ncbi:MAG TPA: hypothetical protein VIY54_11845 [Steroidobacteraceae bacterium]
MVANSSNRLRGSERRPAIWPWLAMPLATLALFCALAKLQQVKDVSAEAPATHSSGTSGFTPGTQ